MTSSRKHNADPSEPDPRFVCVFCGSSSGSRPAYTDAARRLGAALVHGGLGLVYGGGRVGLMGVVADAVLAAGGAVIGVIPDPLALREVAHHGLTELIVVPGMHERKALMAERASAFVVLPGGVGTFEEFFEVLTWSVLGLHRKPIGILNVAGYFDPLIALINHTIDEGFARPQLRDLITVSDDPETLAASLLRRGVPPAERRWIDANET